MPSFVLDNARVRQLVEAAARVGKISYQTINDLLGDLSIAEDDVEELLEVLEARGIEVVESEDDSAEPEVEPSAPKSRTPRPRASKHGDLDDVLSSLENLEQFAGGRPPSIAGAVSEEDDIREDEVDADIAVEDALRQYMNRMGRVPLLTAAEEKRLAQLAKNGTPEAVSYTHLTLLTIYSV